MSFSFDSYGKLKQPKMFLYNSKTNPVGTIAGAMNIKLEQNFHKLFELNFKIYKNVNNEETEFYDKIIKNKLIEVQNINWFQILSAVEKYDDTAKETYKEVKCCPLENSLIYRKVYDINGVFGLYDISSPNTSLLHIISAECGWQIGHVSNSLLSKFRTFSIDSMEIYNLLTTKIQDSFGCIIQFDSYSKTINASLLSELNELTDIVISKKNVLREYIKDDSENAIITKMRVRGGDDGNGNQVDIRSVNFGRIYRVNLDYYMTTEWVSQSLVDAYNVYQAALANARNSFNTTLSTLKTKNAELTVLKTDLSDLRSLKSAQENVMGASVQLHNRVPIPTDVDYTTYQNAVTLFNTYLTQIASKELEIKAKQNEIASVQNTLDSISNSIDESNYFSSAQISEMNNFIVEGDDFEDSTYVINSESSEEEALEIKTELMQSADEALAIKSKPNYTFTIKASSLYTIQDDKDELIPYSKWREQLKVGSLITLFIDNTWTTVRLMSIIIDFDNPEEIEMKFSTKSRLDDELTQLAEILADSGRTSSSLSLKQLGYDAASKQSSQVREFMNGSLNATLNSIKTNDNQDPLIDGYGIHMRKWLPEQNKYHNDQLWITNNVLLMSDDSWNSSKLGIGRLLSPDGLSSYWGINAEVLVGSLIMGEKLVISNQSGTYTINASGFTASASLSGTTYSVGINPSTPSEILNIKVNGVNQMYIDTVTKKLTFNGALGADSINANMINALSIVAGSVKSDWIYTGSLNANQITVGTIIADSVKSGWVYTGGISADQITTGTISGVKFYGTGSSNIDTFIDISYSTLNTRMSPSGIEVSDSSDVNGFVSIDVYNGITVGYPYSTINSTFINNYGIETPSITCNTINDATPITSFNIESYAAPSYHYHGTLYDGVGKVTAYGNNFRPHSDSGDNTISCGSPSYRWTQVFAATATISTSDENEKDIIGDLSEAERRVANKIKNSVITFKFKDAVLEKGENARIHIGTTAQMVANYFIEEGLDPNRYALFCSDSWYEKDGKATNENDIPYSSDDSGVVLKTRLGIRYEELICFVLGSI